MQYLKVLSLMQRSTLFKYPAKFTCVSKFLHYNDKIRYTNHAPKCVMTYNHFNSIENYFVPDHLVVCKRFKQTSGEESKNVQDTSEQEETPEKLSLFQRYKKMLKEYWYVLIPVHMVTSAFWFGGFYYAATCGIDIVPFLEYISLPEVLIAPLRNSALGYIAVASAFYKLATPARYMVTLGGTSFSVKFLVSRGLIKPIPTKDQIKTIIQSKFKKDK